MKTVSKTPIKKLYIKRPKWCHKGNYGKLLIIGGSKKYSGSPALASLAAIKSGVDLVTTVCPKRAADIVAGFSPDLIAHPLKGDYINPSHLREVLDLAKNQDAVVIGGGLERNIHTLDFVLKFLEKITIPCVIDADAIHAFRNNLGLLKSNFVLTPHSYEFSILSNTMPKNVIKKRAALVKKLASKTGATILLKGCIDVISDGKKTVLNKTGCPEMTKGGTGDTLAGICGALLARGATPLEAACGAAYINGKAGELAAKEFGESMLAMDIVNNIYKILM